jgi:hypothetical protein
LEKEKLKGLYKHYILVLALWGIASSCVPQAENSGSGSSSTSEDEAGTSTSTSVAASSLNSSTDSSLVWFSTKEIPGTITINSDIETVIYIRGPSLNTFLSTNSNDSKRFCLVASLKTANAVKQLRFRAAPISFTNFATNSVERLLRIDLPSETDNALNCTGSVANIELGGIAGAVVSSPADIAFVPSKTCPTCTSVITATDVSLYGSNNGVISQTTKISNIDLPLSSLGLRVDPKSNSTSEVSFCSNSICNAKGFDCCIQGQCVNNGQLKANASSEADFTQALADIATNPQNFSNYPNIFFVCTGLPAPTPTPTATPDIAATSNAAFEALKKEFLCFEGEKATPQDFSNCAPTADNAAYLAIRNDVWLRCGCEATPFPNDPEEPFCPDFGLKATFDNQDNITSVLCDIPQPLVDPTPFQNTAINVPARSAPHRFFQSTDGTPVDDLSTIAGSAILQEGDSFSYLDESGKTDPIDSDFSMNAILGQMTVTLDRTLPAKQIEVPLDVSLVISTLSGFYTACPQCIKDAWFDSFTAHPSSQQGIGLTAVGHSSSRDTFSNNTTVGNYEDTIFGRACWLPPTMIPLTHQKDADLQTQRLTRLRAQAAMYANGMQRDWYGFNKGALIGSFDGVKWFAIGKGRRILTTSTKLFLAINAPFADLAAPSDFVVSITTDIGVGSVADVDFDPNISVNDSRQNTAGTCQSFHQCNTDADCVTRLGWEYTCLDTTRFKTNWPKFDEFGNEVANDEFAQLRFDDILHGDFPSGSRRRCVYKGAGSVCKLNYKDNFTNEEDKKFFTCAPNFYCSSFDNSDFNTKVARTPNVVEVFLFGQDADILGRPVNYLGATSPLPSDIKSNMINNIDNFSSNTADFGLCRPGKSLASDLHVNQHNTPDSSKRTDYVSQVGSCDSKATGDDRARSCPIFGEDDTVSSFGNYIYNNTAPVDLTANNIQNACGNEALDSNKVSAFKAVEAEKLSSVLNLVTPSIVQDACFRRAGSVCHTDLDCSPNKLHASQATLAGLNFFGGTEAEQKYWEENLICGQARPQPNLNAANFDTFDLSLNRCCREIGSTLTMFTQTDDPTNISPSNGSTNDDLSVATLTRDDPSATGRYSRYSVVDLKNPSAASLNISDSPEARAPIANQNTTPVPFQWKTFNDTARRSCCGGGWVRKFSDGGHDWSNTSRISFNIENFQCLNYANDLALNKPINSEVDNDNYDRDFGNLCLSPSLGGCIQREIPQPASFEVVVPAVNNTSTATMESSPTQDPVEAGIVTQVLSTEVPYMPTPTGGDPTVVPLNFFSAPTGTPLGVSFILPIYVGHRGNIEAVRVRYFLASNADSTTIDVTANENVACNPANEHASDKVGMGGVGDQAVWCVKEATTGLLLFHIRADPDQQVALKPWVYAGVEIEFNLAGAAPAASPNNQFASPEFIDGGNQGLNAGNALYYLTKLARLELTGIPQIFYEPMYCNSNNENLVPGIYTATTRTEFNTAGFLYDPPTGRDNLARIYDENSVSGQLTDASNPTGEIVYQDQISVNTVFSDNEFVCCLELGDATDSPGQCCSNFAAEVDGQLTCRLPQGTNISVYFNRFVSGDGFGTDQPGGGLADENFIPETGEPKLNQATHDKLIALGRAFCEGADVRQGAAFGNFFGEPNSGFFNDPLNNLDGNRIFSIIDSNQDADGDDPLIDAGTIRFLEGFRWNQQFYCL